MREVKKSKILRGGGETLSYLLAAAILSAGFSANAASQTVTNTLDGVTSYPSSTAKWQIVIDTSAKTAKVGRSNSNTSNADLINARRALQSASGRVVIPEYFTYNGNNYKTTMLADRSFYKLNGFTSLVIPYGVTKVESYAFNYCKMENVLFKGPTSAGVGESQSFTTVSIFNTAFSNCSRVKLIVVGPNVKYNNPSKNYNLKLPSASNAVVLAPRRSANTTWKNANTSTYPFSGTNNSLKFYGPDYDFDMTMGETTMTFYPNNDTGIDWILAKTETFKSAFNMNSAIVLTNSFATSAALTEAMMKNVTLEFNYTDNATAPVLTVPSATMTSSLKVKVTAPDGVKPNDSARVLTSGGVFAGKTVSLASGSAEWATSVFVNSDGDLEVKVKGGFIMIVR